MSTPSCMSTAVDHGGCRTGCVLRRRRRPTCPTACAATNRRCSRPSFDAPTCATPTFVSPDDRWLVAVREDIGVRANLRTASLRSQPMGRVRPLFAEPTSCRVPAERRAIVWRSSGSINMPWDRVTLQACRSPTVRLVPKITWSWAWRTKPGPNRAMGPMAPARVQRRRMVGLYAVDEVTGDVTPVVAGPFESTPAGVRHAAVGGHRLHRCRGRPSDR